MRWLAVSFVPLLFAFQEAPQQEDLERVVEDLIRDLGSSEVEVRDRAAEALLRLGDKSIPALRKAERDENPEVRARAKDILQNLQRGVDLSVPEVLQAVTDKTGVQFVLAPRSGIENSTVSVPLGYLSGDRMFERCLNLLRSAGFAAVRMAGDAVKTWRIVPMTLAMKLDLPVYASVGDLPDREEVCRLSLRPKGASPRDVHALLINMATNPQGIFPVSSAGAIVITDYVSNLRRFAELVRMMDDPPETEYFTSFTLVRGRGEGDPESPAVPKELARFGATLRSAAPFARYEKVASAAVRVRSAPAEFRSVCGRPAPAPEEEPGRTHLSLGAEVGYEVEFSPQTSGRESILFRNLRLLREDQARITTTVTVKKGEQAVVGWFQPAGEEGTLILLAELRAAR